MSRYCFIFLCFLSAESSVIGPDEQEHGIENLAEASNKSELEGRIWRGISTGYKAHRYFVSISKNFGRGFYSVCGGSFITMRVVITAAHCFDDLPDLYSVKVRFSVNEAYGRPGTTEDFGKGWQYSVTGIYRHPAYIEGKKRLDIALVILNREVDSSVRPLHLPEPGMEKKYVDAISVLLVGMGKSFGDDRGHIMKMVDVHLTRNCTGLLYEEQLDYNLCSWSKDDYRTCDGNIVIC